MNTPVPAPHINRCKIPPSLDEEWKTAAVISVPSDKVDSEFNSDTVTDTEESEDGGVKPYSP